MANKTMHHVVIGDDTFELIDEAGREETTQLKEDLTQSVDNLKSALGVLINEKTFDIVAGWQSVVFPLVNGNTYIATLSSTNIGLYASVDGTSNTYEILNGQEFTASQSTTYLRIWSPGNEQVTITEKGLKIEEIEYQIQNLIFDKEIIETIISTKKLPDDIWSRGTIDINTSSIINYRASSRISAIFTSAIELEIYIGGMMIYAVDLDASTVLHSWVKGAVRIPANSKVGITIARTSGDTSAVDTDTLTNHVYVINGVDNQKYHKGMQSIARVGYNVDNPNTPPEMSIWSYQEAYVHGYHIMLTDVVWTSDLVPVALHDTTINRVARNADGSVISEPIDPTTKTYAELDEYDYGIYKGELYKGTKLTTIGGIALWCKMNACELYLEIRPNVVTAQMAKRLCDALAQYGMIDYCTFIVPSASTMTEIEAYAGKQRVGIVLAQNYTDAQNTALADQIIALKESGHDAFAYYYSLPMSADMISDTVYNYLVNNQLYAEFTEVRDNDYLTAFLSYHKTRIFNRVAVRPEPIYYQALSLYI